MGTTSVPEALFGRVWGPSWPKSQHKPEKVSSRVRYWPPCWDPKSNKIGEKPIPTPTQKCIVFSMGFCFDFFSTWLRFGPVLVVQVGAMLGSWHHPRGQEKADSQNGTKWHGATARAQFRGSSGTQDEGRIDQKSIRNSYQHRWEIWSHLDIEIA